MASDIWQRTTQIAREETHFRQMSYSFRLTARVLLYVSSHIPRPVVEHLLEREIACRTSGYGYDLTVKLHSWDFPVYIQHPHDRVMSRVIFSGVGDEREREMFYLTTHSTHFIYGYMASDIWVRTILIVRQETRDSYRLTARVLLYASSHRQDNTYHGLCYTSCGALAGTRNSSMGSHHEGSIRRLIAP